MRYLGFVFARAMFILFGMLALWPHMDQLGIDAPIVAFCFITAGAIHDRRDCVDASDARR